MYTLNPAFKAISQQAPIHLSNLIPNVPQLGHSKSFPWESIIIPSSTLFTLFTAKNNLLTHSSPPL